MIKRLQTLVLLLFPCLLPASTDGLISVMAGWDSASSRTISLFKGPEDTVPVVTGNAFQLLPARLEMHVDFGHSYYYYRCAGESFSRWAIRDEKKKEVIYWIEKDSLTYFYSWGDWWLNADGFVISGKIRQQPDDRSPAIKEDSVKCRTFNAIAIEGDWLYVSYCMLSCSDVAGIKGLTYAPVGWVRWRKGDEILGTIWLPE